MICHKICYYILYIENIIVCGRQTSINIFCTYNNIKPRAAFLLEDMAEY